MTGRSLTARLALVVAAMMAVLSSGALGVVHRQAEHAHVAPASAHVHDHGHSCRHDLDGPSLPDQSDQPADHGHDEGECELCLMLAVAGQWGMPAAGQPLGLTPLCVPAPVLAQAVIGAFVPRAHSARGPPTPGV